MARRRFFVDEVQEGHAEIRGENAHHLTRVLRVQAGQTFEVTDNHGVWLATVESARKDLVRFDIVSKIDSGPELPPVTLYLALFKFDRFEWAVEKATELGVTRIVPVETQRSDQGLFEGSKKRVERWRRIAKEASEQSRRMRAPEVDDAIRFARIPAPAPEECRLWLDERPGASPLLTALADHAKQDSAIAFAIGPEGGWTEAERTALTEMGWQGASLGTTVLRAETAVCAALAVTAAWRQAGYSGR